MQEPQRGEICRLRMRGRVGTEIRGDRFCLIVSADRFNKRYPRITVVPLTSYTEEREYSRPLWSVIVQQANSKNNESDIDIDSHNANCPHGKLKIWETDENGKEKVDQNGNQIPYRSIVDCGQLLTVWSFDPSQYPKLPKDLRRQVGWDMRHGVLKEKATVCVNSALQVVIGGGIRYEGNLSFREGDVLSADFLGMDGKWYRRQCLVVSSSGVDAVRERISAGSWGRLEQCTVVPLDESAVPGSVHVQVNVHTKANQLVPNKTMAVCREIDTINWRNGSRRKASKDGSVSNDDLEKVREALRRYLDLPR